MNPAAPPPLEGLDLAVATALQVDPRASWRRIAQVLAAPERTVARHGAALLESGVVQVAGMPTKAETALLTVRCAPGTARVAVEALAQRADTTFAYAVTGAGDAVAELLFDAGRMTPVLLQEIPTVVGLTQVHTAPILRYFRTIRRWTSGALTAAQVAALRTADGPEMATMGHTEPLGPVDRRLVEALVADGRATVEALARAADVSESTAARRLTALLSSARVQVRALVEPALLGLPVEAMLWISAAPSQMDRLGALLAEDPRVRYAAAVAGPHQVVADVTCRTTAELYELTTASPWVEHTSAVETSLVLHARNRGVPLRTGRPPCPSPPSPAPSTRSRRTSSPPS